MPSCCRPGAPRSTGTGTTTSAATTSPAPCGSCSMPLRRRRGRRPAAPKPVTWYGLLAVVAALVVFGLVMVLSASSVQSQRELGSTWSYFLRQAFATALGCVALLVSSRVPYQRWRRLVPMMLVVTGLLLLVVLIPGVGVQVNGARSWIGAGPLRFQPAEIAKLTLLLFAADLLARRARRMDDARMTL